MTETQNQPQLSWPTLRGWLAQNSTKTRSLPPHAAPTLTESIPIEKESATEWRSRRVEPSHPLCAVLLLQDGEFEAGTAAMRNGQLLTTVTELQGLAAQQLKGRAWPVRKTVEGLAAIANEEKHLWTPIGWRALCALRECQLILVDHSAKTIRFVPEEVSSWNSEYETYFMTPDAATLWIPPKGFTAKSIYDWILLKEGAQYNIEFPEAADAPVDELRKKAVALGIAMEPKSTKAQLVRRIGRAAALATLKGF